MSRRRPSASEASHDTTIKNLLSFRNIAIQWLNIFSIDAKKDDQPVRLKRIFSMRDEEEEREDFKDILHHGDAGIPEKVTGYTSKDGKTSAW